MKHKVLLLSKSPSTSIGLRSYLTNIFGPYIDLEACLTDIVTREFFAGGGAELVLFASDAAFQAAEPFMPEPTPYIRCVRTFNYTYLHRILTIPSGEKVYVVNDTLANARLAIEMLGQVGLSQYHFLPFGPGAGENPGLFPSTSPTWWMWESACRISPRLPGLRHFLDCPWGWWMR